HYVANATFHQCRFISHVYSGAGMVPPVGVHLGGRDGAAGNARNVEFEQCAWRAAAQHGLAFRAIGFGTTGSYSNIRVRAPLWITLTAPHQVKYAPEPHPDSAVRIEEAGSVTLAAGPARPTLILRKLQSQAIPPNADTAIVFESALQGSGFADGKVAVAQSYWLEAWFAVDGLDAGDEVAVSFTVDDAVWRQGFFRAGGMARETFQLHCVAPLPQGARVGARVRIRAAGQRTVIGGPGVAGFSVVALS
ncbi:MAG: hypothetical protein HY060_17560, partial [Proteobacteria bacterium]|nr:hypothetical protein [Pseudomonadota bacterium]